MSLELCPAIYQQAPVKGRGEKYQKTNLQNSRTTTEE
jgi:hypothetical protein